MRLHPMSTMRRTGRQLAVLLLALVSAFSLLYGAAAPTANAEVPENQMFTDIDWHIDDYDAPPNTHAARDNMNGYNAMVNALRAAAGHQMPGVSDSPAYMDTPTRTNSNRVIRVLVWRNGSADLALYFNVDNLYFLGYSATARHYRIVPRPNQADRAYTNHLPERLRVRLGSQTPLMFNQITGDGSYAQMSAPPEWRGAQVYTASMILTRLLTLTRVEPGDQNTTQSNQAMAYIIQATSEAARFGWIQNRIGQTIYQGGDWQEEGAPANLGPFGTDLETRWSDLSRMAHNTAAHRVDPGVTINNRTYRSVNDIGNPGNNQPRLTPFLALYASGQP
ncbi:Ribosome inactivating protein [Streptomyces sp. TLI_053]|uniref:ribosome-inactivating family protein n=1 Tax=Streptomyces sp. TLI_053 TaxID=1855352 RepID=UPI0008799B49|nr:ribosome-inactivating family protein [Streptomyces sp. TLI_053]SDT83390.1 Ribosome inactivating protein [Streptomyces sp. TLI_053]